MIQGVRNIIRRWYDSANSIHPLSAIVEEWNKEKVGEVTYDPASLATLTTREDTIALPAGTASVGDLVFVAPPVTLNGGIMVMGARISATDTLAIRLYNSTAGAIDVASAQWTYALIVGKQLNVI